MTNINAHFQPENLNKDDDLATLLANRLTPTADQIAEWLQSPLIKQWLTKQPMGIPNTLKVEIINTIIKNINSKQNEDCQVQYGGAVIGVDVLRWQLWASYRPPFGSTIKSPDCPYTLLLHLESQTNKLA
ncbi:hypothetical protein WKK05_40490 (plasmid) [Nostoc sp. UHCC 0302]|uniref:hypothetical protein n=1 Tax=Nostoc sp. UHCC 0302 TaxID=3134896 RepID=UPI00311CD17B